MRTIDTGNLSSDSTKLNNNISEIDSEIKKLNSTIEDNKEGFDGERGTSFFKILTESYIADLNDLKSDMESYQDFLSKIPKAYEILDEEIENMNIDV